MDLVVATKNWPDSIDTTATLIFLGAVAGLTVLGYLWMAIDFRAYLRSLRRALVRVAGRWSGVPQWARSETPRAVAALGLQMPCTVEDLMQAYRRKVKYLHPDRGGDMRQFLILQACFEEALRIVGEQPASDVSEAAQSRPTTGSPPARG